MGLGESLKPVESLTIKLEKRNVAER